MIARGGGTLDITLTGPLILLLWVLVTVNLWTGVDGFAVASAVLLAPLIFLMALRASRPRLIFVGIGLSLFVIAILTRPNWLALTEEALERSAFITAYFAALATLRHAADTSPSVAACGMFLAHQPPGRRYIALSAGAQVFAIPLNYGSIALLGSLAKASAQDEPDEVVRNHRIRRMLLAIQRGFNGMLTWSPLAFAVVITTILLPEAVWARALPFLLVTSALLVGIGWALDTIFKPRVPGRAPARATSDYGTWGSVLPLAVLLSVLLGLAVALHLSTGHKVTTVILLLVPAVAAIWFGVQGPKGGHVTTAATRSMNMVRNDLPTYREEFIMMAMSGFIGTLGGELLTPVIEATGFDLARLPGWVALVALVWLTPLAGQIGMSPLLAVTLMFPIIPHPAEIGVTPTALFVAITGGWALGAASSPIAAPTLLVARFGGVTPSWVSWRWNGAYTLLCGLAISAWVFILATFGMG